MTGEGELDQRQRRTRVALHDALGRMIERMPYSQIGISQLAHEAGIGRPTFYRHFPTVDALLIDRFATDRVEQREVARRAMTETGDIGLATMAATTFAFERIAAQPRLYHALLDGSAGTNATTLFGQQISDLVALLPFPPGSEREANPALAIGMTAGATSGFLLAWLDAGLQPDPATAARLLLAMLNLSPH